MHWSRLVLAIAICSAQILGSCDLQILRVPVDLSAVRSRSDRRMVASTNQATARHSTRLVSTRRQVKTPSRLSPSKDHVEREGVARR
jgi:hypothetical protein